MEKHKYVWSELSIVAKRNQRKKKTTLLSLLETYTERHETWQTRGLLSPQLSCSIKVIYRQTDAVCISSLTWKSKLLGDMGSFVHWVYKKIPHEQLTLVYFRLLTEFMRCGRMWCLSMRQNSWKLTVDAKCNYSAILVLGICQRIWGKRWSFCQFCLVFTVSLQKTKLWAWVISLLSPSYIATVFSVL